MDHYAKAYPIFSRIKGYEDVKEMLKSLKRFSKDDVAQERLRIIKFYNQYGERTTREAFEVGRDTVWIWKKRLRDNRNSISSLIPTPTTPKTKRTMLVHPKAIAHIRSLREEHVRLGKEKINPLLDEFCKKEGLPAIKESTIGKAIRRIISFFKRVEKYIMILLQNGHEKRLKRRRKTE